MSAVASKSSSSKWRMPPEKEIAHQMNNSTYIINKKDGFCMWFVWAVTVPNIEEESEIHRLLDLQCHEGNVEGYKRVALAPGHSSTPAFSPQPHFSRRPRVSWIRLFHWYRNQHVVFCWALELQTAWHIDLVTYSVLCTRALHMLRREWQLYLWDCIFTCSKGLEHLPQPLAPGWGISSRSRHLTIDVTDWPLAVDRWVIIKMQICDQSFV